MHHSIYLVLLLAMLSCGGKPEREMQQKQEQTKHDLADLRDTLIATVNGKSFSYTEIDARKKDSFEHYTFQFRDDTKSIYIHVDFSVEGSPLPYSTTIGPDKKILPPVDFSYERVPDIYPFAKEKNIITITEWNQEEKWMSAEFEGTVINVDHTGEFHLKGKMYKVRYQTYTDERGWE